MAKNLISSQFMIQVPIVQVKIGDYEFGVYKKSDKGKITYPNYIQSLEIIKVNGQVNNYNLTLNYPINENFDPNYFEKVFSSVSKSRKIVFTYGDAATPNYLYKEEEAIITKVKSRFQLDSSLIVYTVSAVSQSKLGFSGAFTLGGYQNKKPSDEIRRILTDPQYGLQDLFTGMRNMTTVSQYRMIPDNDMRKNILKKDNISVLDYLEYLVSLMTPDEADDKKSSIYILTFVDDTSGEINGPYFKINEIDTNIEHPEAYQLDIGYPGSNYVFDFNVENDENYSIYYDYQNKIHPQEYVTRLNADGDFEDVYAPTSTTNNSIHTTTEDVKSWWAKVTEYPIKASITIKGLLRPAILMTYVRLNIILYGQKHINSGLYIITKQVDRVDGQSGYQTTLNMTKIANDVIL